MADTLNEAASRYLMEGSTLVKKWGKKITEVNSLLMESQMPVLGLDKQVALAKLLNNAQDRLDYAKLNEATQNSMVGPYKKYALDIIAGMVPNLIAFDLVNVQPIENKMGIINYVKFQTGSNKAGHAIGDEIASTFNYTGTNKGYTAQDVTNQPIAYVTNTGTVTFILPWKPVIKGNVSLTFGSIAITDSPIAGTDTGSLTGTGVSAGTINYLSGQCSITFTVAPAGTEDLIGSWVFNNEYAPVDVPEIQLSITSIPIMAQSRKLKALWSFDAAYEMQKEYGQDLNGLLAAQASAEIAHEIDKEILDDLYAWAYTSVAQPALTWDATAPVGVAQSQHFESFRTVLNKASNRIYQNTKRAMGNFVVVGTNVATVIESTPSFNAKDNGNNVGPYFMGNWGGYKVFKNPFYPADQFLIGFKGNTLFEAGYCYAPYMPVATTQMLMLADFQGQQGWATSYGKTILNPYMYVKGSITGLV